MIKLLISYKNLDMNKNSIQNCIELIRFSHSIFQLCLTSYNFKKFQINLSFMALPIMY